MKLKRAFDKQMFIIDFVLKYLINTLRGILVPGCRYPSIEPGLLYKHVYPELITPVVRLKFVSGKEQNENYSNFPFDVHDGL